MNLINNQMVQFLSSNYMYNYLPTIKDGRSVVIFTVWFFGSIALGSALIAFNRKNATLISLIFMIAAIPLVLNFWAAMIFYYGLGAGSIFNELKNSLSLVGWFTDNVMLFLLSFGLLLDQCKNKSKQMKLKELAMLFLGTHLIYLPRLILKLKSREDMQNLVNTDISNFTILISVVGLMSICSLIPAFIYHGVIKSSPLATFAVWSIMLLYISNSILFMPLLRSTKLKIFFIIIGWLYVTVPLAIFLLILRKKNRRYISLDKNSESILLA